VKKRFYEYLSLKKKKKDHRYIQAPIWTLDWPNDAMVPNILGSTSIFPICHQTEFSTVAERV